MDTCIVRSILVETQTLYTKMTAHEWAMLYHPAASTGPPPHKYQRLPLRVSQRVLNDFVESRPIRCVGWWVVGLGKRGRGWGWQTEWLLGGAGGLDSPYFYHHSLTGTHPIPSPQCRSCTHYDAFRFFAPEARALNVYAEDLATRKPGQVLHEQPGCLHAGMGAWRGGWGGGPTDWVDG